MVVSTRSRKPTADQKSGGIPVGGLTIPRPVLLWAIFLLALCVRSLYLFEYSQSYQWDLLSLDAKTHDLLGREIAEKGLIGDHPFFRAPLYPYLVGAIYTLFGPGLLLPRIINIVCGAFSCLLLFLIGERVFRPAVGLLASLTACLYWVLIYFEGELLHSAVNLFQILLFFHLLLASEGRRNKTLAAAGLVLGLATITRPNILVFFPCVLAWLAMTCRNWKREFPGRALVLFIPAMLVIFAVTLRNYVVGGDTVLISYQGGINFHIGNNPNASGLMAVAPYDVDRIPSEYRRKHADNIWCNDDVWLGGYYVAEEEMGRELKPSEVQEYWYGETLNYIMNNKVEFLALLLQKTYYFLNAYEVPSNEDLNWFVRKHSHLLGLLSVLDFGIIISLGLLGMAVSLGRWQKTFLLLSYVPIHAAGSIAFFINPRCRVPTIPFLLLFGSIFVLWVVEQVRARKLARPGLAVVFCCGSLLFTHTAWFNIKDTEVSATLHYNSGSRLAERGMLEASAAEYEQAVRLLPSRAEPYELLCWNLNALGQHDQAEIWARRGLARFPDNVKLRFPLATAYVGKGELGRAIVELEVLVRMQPNDLVSCGNLGILYYQVGDLDAAADRFRKNIGMRLDNLQFQLIAYIHLGLIALEREDYAEALDAFRAGLEIDPRAFDALFRSSVEGSRLAPPGAVDEALQGLLRSGSGADQEEIERVVARLRQVLGSPGPGDASGRR